MPPPKEPRPNPVKMLSETAVHAATSAFKHRAPQRANTMSGAVVTTSPQPASSTAVTPVPSVDENGGKQHLILRFVCDLKLQG